MSSRDLVMLAVAAIAAIGAGFAIYRMGLASWVRRFRAPKWLRVLSVLEAIIIGLLLASLLTRSTLSEHVSFAVVCGVLVAAGFVIWGLVSWSSAGSIEH